MKLICFAVFDAKAKLHLQPFFMRSVAEAVRAFGDLVNEQGHSFNLHPFDYTLVQLADYQEETGMLTPLKEPCVLVNGKQVYDDPNGHPGQHLLGNGAEQYADLQRKQQMDLEDLEQRAGEASDG